MKRALTALFIMSAAVFQYGGLNAQETDSPEPSVSLETEVQEPVAAEPAKLQPSVSGKNTGKTAANPVKQDANPAVPDSLSLLETGDGDFRSARIPGITFEKKGVIEAGKDDAAQTSGGKIEMTKKSAIERMLPFLTVAGIVIIIVLIYRIGKRKRRGNVFRRFP